MDVLNVEQWKQMSSACVAMKLKPWSILNYWVWDTVTQTQTLKEFNSTCEIARFQ